MSGRSQYSLWAGTVVLAVAVVAAWYFLPIRDWVQPLNAWIQGLGAWGAFIFASVYVIVVVALAPAEIMSIAAGFIFGPWGLPTATVSLRRRHVQAVDSRASVNLTP
jgi:uncharacterized membrane protein YdjX (TVP38/TMEM64 family)